jgi:hypothetical protein
MFINLIHGNAADFDGEADLVITNPYGPLPVCLQKTSMIITNFNERHAQCQEWTGNELTHLDYWDGGRQSAWMVNMQDYTGLLRPLHDLKSDDVYYPLSLPLRLLVMFAKKGDTIIDPFMGRGTVGKACKMLSFNFIGIDRDAGRCQMAREYIGDMDNGKKAEA